MRETTDGRTRPNCAIYPSGWHSRMYTQSCFGSTFFSEVFVRPAVMHKVSCKRFTTSDIEAWTWFHPMEIAGQRAGRIWLNPVRERLLSAPDSHSAWPSVGIGERNI